MSTATTEPEQAEPAGLDAVRATGPAPTGLLRVTAIVATIGVGVALIGLLMLFRPVHTPTQDCGTSIGFLLDGRVNVFVSEDDPPKGITTAEAKANNANPCRTRVADRAKPAAALMAGGLLVAIIASIVEIASRSIAWRHRRRARVDGEDDGSGNGNGNGNGNGEDGDARAAAEGVPAAE